MGSITDPFLTLDAPAAPQDTLPGPADAGPIALALGGSMTTARLYGFDLSDRPLVTGLASAPGVLIAARTTVALRRDMIGATLVVLYEDANPLRPIIVGAIRETALTPEAPTQHPPPLEIQSDEERILICAEREVVLRCGEASITLTRAGKVIIQGNYVVSRSRGYNKLKGAAIELN